MSMIAKQKRKFPALILFLLGFLAGNLIPNLIWKMKWQQKTWASRHFRKRISFGNPEIQRLLLSAESDLWIFCFWSTTCSSHTSAVRIVHRYDHVGVYPGIRICRRSDRNGTVAPAVSFLYSGLALFHGTGVGNVCRNLEKQRNILSESRCLCRPNVHCCHWLPAGNPCRMLYKPMDHQ